jgi:hypothetical protein
MICPAQTGGQQPTQTGAEVSQHDAPFTFSTGVNPVLVPVVVRDREGRAIGTLKKEDSSSSTKAERYRNYVNVAKFRGA